MKGFGATGLAVLAAGLLLYLSWPSTVNAEELDFGKSGGSKSGSGQFAKYVPQGDRTLIGKIPVGITNLSINLTAVADLDIELWDGNVFVVGWEANGNRAIIHGETQTTGDYNDVTITWTGWNGVDGNLGSESITIAGTTKNTFIMKAFGYEGGSVKVDYSWDGTYVLVPAATGSGKFYRAVPQNDRIAIGTIPTGVDNLQIDLTAAKDLDIELWDGETFVVGWQSGGKQSLIYSNSPVTGFYGGVTISWTGWDGSNGKKGDESVSISGTTQNPFLMKVFGYQEGIVSVDYTWGFDPEETTVLSAQSSTATPSPTPTPAPTPAPTPTPTPKLAPITAPTPTMEAAQTVSQKVKTWIGGPNGDWDKDVNWNPFGVPEGSELILIEGNSGETHSPIMNVDFTLTTGTMNIGAINSVLQISQGITFTNFGTVNAKGRLTNNGSTVNNGVYNNENLILTSGETSSFVNHVGGTLNNAAGGSSVGLITNACGGTITDSGKLSKVELVPCIWSGAGGNDYWSNPANWANGLVPPEDHPVLINSEGGKPAKVILDVYLTIQSKTLTISAKDTLTIGQGRFPGVSLTLKEPGGMLVNRGTVIISNYSRLNHDGPSTFNNVKGNVHNTCQGTVPLGGVTGAAIIQDPCFWDGGGVTNNWTDAANWDADIVPTSNDPILIRDADGEVTTVNLDKSFDINSQGYLMVSGGQTLNIGSGIVLRIADQSPGGSIWINGTLNINGGVVQNQNTGLIINRGTINNNGGELINQGTSLVNKSSGTINNIGGLVANGAGAGFTNDGTTVNDAASNFVLSNAATLINNGSLTNAGLFNTTSGGGNVVIGTGGTLVNTGTLNQGGAGVFSTKAGSTITNSGRINMFESLFSNGGSIDNSGALEVFHFGSYQNASGELNNRTGGVITISGSVSNLANSSINNSGEIINHRTLVNAGAITNSCGGALTGQVKGNQPLDACSLV